MGDSVFLGRTVPPRSQQLTTTLGLFHQQLRISALVDRQSGHIAQNYNAVSLCSAGRCRAAVDPTTPLEQQAAAAAIQMAPIFWEWEGGWESADVTRLRELSVTATLPQRLLLPGVRDATVTVQARNLAILSQKGLKGQDPESTQAPDLSGLAVSSTATRNVPQSRTWIVRLDIGF